MYIFADPSVYYWPLCYVSHHGTKMHAFVNVLFAAAAAAASFVVVLHANYTIEFFFSCVTTYCARARYEMLLSLKADLTLLLLTTTTRRVARCNCKQYSWNLCCHQAKEEQLIYSVELSSIFSNTLSRSRAVSTSSLNLHSLL
jgi:hypothetical protein